MGPTAARWDASLTLLSFSGLKAEPLPPAAEALSGEAGGPGTTVATRPPSSVSREEVAMLGEVSAVAGAQARGAPTQPTLTAAVWAAGPR